MAIVQQHADRVVARIGGDDIEPAVAVQVGKRDALRIGSAAQPAVLAVKPPWPSFSSTLTVFAARIGGDDVEPAVVTKIAERDRRRRRSDIERRDRRGEVAEAVAEQQADVVAAFVGVTRSSAPSPLRSPSATEVGFAPTSNRPPPNKVPPAKSPNIMPTSLLP